MSSLPPENIPYSPAAAEPPRTSGKAIASLVLGILSIACCMNVATGIPAVILGWIGLDEIKASRGRVTGRGLAISGIVTGALGSTLVGIAQLGVLLALLLPAVQAARTAARRNGSMNNMKQIGLGLHAELGAHGSFPATTTQDDAGNPLLSWRVTILPHVGDEALYKQFKTDEPWNGPSNNTLVASEPHIYICPNANRRSPGETNVVAIVGPDTVLTPAGGVGLRDVPDGLSQTIVAVELADTGIVWSEPHDISIDEFVAAVQRKLVDQGLRPAYPGGAVCLFADGSVHFINSDTPPELLRALCTRNGGEPIDWSQLGH